MTRVTFAKAFRRHIDCPDDHFNGVSVGQVLHAYFGKYPAVRSYTLDDQGAIRQHVAVFVNNDQLIDRRTLADPVCTDDTIYVFQALSGGCR